MSLRRWCLQLQRHISLTDNLFRDEAFDDNLVTHWLMPDNGIGHARTAGNQLEDRHKWLGPLASLARARLGVFVSYTPHTHITLRLSEVHIQFPML